MDANPVQAQVSDVVWIGLLTGLTLLTLAFLRLCERA